MIPREGYAPRTCAGCGALYVPTGARQERCAPCALSRTRKAHTQYEADRRARNRDPLAAERRLRRAWRVDGAKARAEMLVAEGASPSRAAEIAGCSHHTVLQHLQSVEVQQRVALLRRHNVPEPEQPC
jgi:DNA-binding CsgD family transcriptional regulator